MHCRTRIAAILFLIAAPATLPAGDFPVLGKIIRHDAKFDELVSKDAKIEVLASGFDWTEGPAWVKKGGYVLFSDVPLNTIMKYKPGEGVSLFLKPSGYTGIGGYGEEPGSNGLAIDREGRLLCCEHGDRRISRMEFGSGKRTLADNYEGKRFNSPNDLAIKSNGDVYFTDPPYGLPKDPKARELDYCGVFRYGTDGKVTLLTKELTYPNGIAFSPDEKTLYIANSDPAKAVWMAYPVKGDGTLGQGKVLFDSTPWVKEGKPGLPDGLKADQRGNLFATGPGGVHVFSSEGKLLGTFDTGEATGNCVFGDEGSTLYIAADMYLCRVKTTTKGAAW